VTFAPYRSVQQNLDWRASAYRAGFPPIHANDEYSEYTSSDVCSHGCLMGSGHSLAVHHHRRPPRASFLRVASPSGRAARACGYAIVYESELEPHIDPRDSEVSPPARAITSALTRPPGTGAAPKRIRSAPKIEIASPRMAVKGKLLPRAVPQRGRKKGAPG